MGFRFLCGSAAALAALALAGCSSEIVGTAAKDTGSSSSSSGAQSSGSSSGSSSSASSSSSSSTGAGGETPCMDGAPCNTPGDTCAFVDAAGCPEALLCNDYCGDDCFNGPLIWQLNAIPAVGDACSKEALACTYRVRTPIPFNEADTTTALVCSTGAWTLDWTSTCSWGNWGCIGPAMVGEACMQCSGCTYQKGPDCKAELFCPMDTLTWQAQSCQ